MKVLECKKCGHVEFEAVPDKCLVCRSPKETFAENPAALKKPANPAALTDPEKKHIPKVTVSKQCGVVSGSPCVDVHVVVGEIPHVMEEKHYITYIDFFLNQKFVSRVWLSPNVCHPAATLHLKAATGTITVLENCNVHGNWVTEVTL